MLYFGLLLSVFVENEILIVLGLICSELLFALVFAAST